MYSVGWFIFIFGYLIANSSQHPDDNENQNVEVNSTNTIVNEYVYNEDNGVQPDLKVVSINPVVKNGVESESDIVHSTVQYVYSKEGSKPQNELNVKDQTEEKVEHASISKSGDGVYVESKAEPNVRVNYKKQSQKVTPLETYQVEYQENSYDKSKDAEISPERAAVNLDYEGTSKDELRKAWLLAMKLLPKLCPQYNKHSSSSSEYTKENRSGITDLSDDNEKKPDEVFDEDTFPVISEESNESDEQENLKPEDIVSENDENSVNLDFPETNINWVNQLPDKTYQDKKESEDWSIENNINTDTNVNTGSLSYLDNRNDINLVIEVLNLLKSSKPSKRKFKSVLRSINKNGNTIHPSLRKVLVKVINHKYNGGDIKLEGDKEWRKLLLHLKNLLKPQHDPQISDDVESDKWGIFNEINAIQNLEFPSSSNLNTKKQRDNVLKVLQLLNSQEPDTENINNILILLKKDDTVHPDLLSILIRAFNNRLSDLNISKNNVWKALLNALENLKKPDQASDEIPSDNNPNGWEFNEEMTAVRHFKFPSTVNRNYAKRQLKAVMKVLQLLEVGTLNKKRVYEVLLSIKHGLKLHPTLYSILKQAVYKRLESENLPGDKALRDHILDVLIEIQTSDDDDGTYGKFDIDEAIETVTNLEFPSSNHDNEKHRALVLDVLNLLKVPKPDKKLIYWVFFSLNNSKRINPTLIAILKRAVSDRLIQSSLPHEKRWSKVLVLLEDLANTAEINVSPQVKPDKWGIVDEINSVLNMDISATDNPYNEEQRDLTLQILSELKSPTLNKENLYNILVYLINKGPFDPRLVLLITRAFEKRSSGVNLSDDVQWIELMNILQRLKILVDVEDIDNIQPENGLAIGFSGFIDNFLVFNSLPLKRENLSQELLLILKQLYLNLKKPNLDRLNIELLLKKLRKYDLDINADILLEYGYKRENAETIENEDQIIENDQETRENNDEVYNESAESDYETIEDDSETTEDDNETIEDDSETTENDDETIEDNSDPTEDDDDETIEDDKDTREDDSETTEDDYATKEDDIQTSEDDNEIIEDESETTEDDSQTSEDYNDTIENNNQAIEDDNETIEDVSETTEDDSETTEDDSKKIEDNEGTIEDYRETETTEVDTIEIFAHKPVSDSSLVYFNKIVTLVKKYLKKRNITDKTLIYQILLKLRNIRTSLPLLKLKELYYKLLQNVRHRKRSFKFVLSILNDAGDLQLTDKDALLRKKYRLIIIGLLNKQLSRATEKERGLIRFLIDLANRPDVSTPKLFWIARYLLKNHRNFDLNQVFFLLQGERGPGLDDLMISSPGNAQYLKSYYYATLLRDLQRYYASAKGLDKQKLYNLILWLQSNINNTSWNVLKTLHEKIQMQYGGSLVSNVDNNRNWGKVLGNVQILVPNFMLLWNQKAGTVKPVPINVFRRIFTRRNGRRIKI